MKDMIKVPFLPLADINSLYVAEYLKELPSLIERQAYILGEAVIDFEQEFADYVGTNYSIGVGNGFDALRIALQIIELKSGDDVLVPANTFIATYLAVSAVGANIIPVEPEPGAYCVSARAFKAAMTKKTKAIIAVHLYGQLYDAPAIAELCRESNCWFVEDAAQAHGAKLGNKSAGAWGDIAAFSFYPGKNLGALGDAGAITTNRIELAEKASQIRNYGSRVKYQHLHAEGCNSRLDTLQAKFLSIKLKGLDRDNAKRREIAKRYVSEIAQASIQLPEIPLESSSHVWHLFVLNTPYREKLQKHLKYRGIQTLIHYPVVCHEQAAYKEVFTKSYQYVEELQHQVLSLPIHPAMQHDQVEAVIDSINSWRH